MGDKDVSLIGNQKEHKSSTLLRCSPRVLALSFISFVLLFVLIIYAVEKTPQGLEEMRCTHVVVGAGWSGVYYMWRLVFAGVLPASEFCVFEASSTRVGGRIASTSAGIGWDGVVEMGGYRFDSGSHPLVKGVIVNNLQLNTSCYDPGSCGIAGMKRVTDAQGQPTGYLQGILGMLSQLQQAGAKGVQMGWEVVALQESGDAASPFRLLFRNGQTAVATSVFLNLPPSAIKALRSDNVRGIDVLAAAVKADPELGSALNAPTNLPAACKQYLFYEDAWWATKLNLTGTFYIDADVTGPGYTPASGRYFDGFVDCNPDGTCRGALLFTYSYDPRCWDGLLPFAKNASTPDQQDTITVIHRGESRHGNELLDISHRRLMEYHAELFREHGVDDPLMVPGPVATSFSLWDLKRNPKLPNIHSLSDANWRVRNKIIVPIRGRKLYIANEGYSAGSGWAEPALVLVERILHVQFSLPRPKWITNPYWNERVIPNLPPATCVIDKDCALSSSSLQDPCSIPTCIDSYCNYVPQPGVACSTGDECISQQTCDMAGICQGGTLFSCNKSSSPPTVCRAPEPRKSPQCVDHIAPFELQNACTAQSTLGDFEIKWELTGVSNESIRVIFSFPGFDLEGWYAMGIGSSMMGADIIVGYAGEWHFGSTIVVQDRYALGYSTPLLDEDVPEEAKRFSGNCTDSLSNTWIDIDQSLGRVRVYFQRPLDTQQPCDQPILLNKPMNLLYAWVADSAYPSFPFHAQNRGSMTVDFGNC